MYKRNARHNNNQLLTIYQGVHITHFNADGQTDRQMGWTDGQTWSSPSMWIWTSLLETFLWRWKLRRRDWIDSWVGTCFGQKEDKSFNDKTCWFSFVVVDVILLTCLSNIKQISASYSNASHYLKITFLCYGIRWPLFFFLHHNFQS